MPFSLSRAMLYVQDVHRLVRFYRDVLGLPLVEEIEGEWAVFAAGSCELALHLVGVPYRTAPGAVVESASNAKLVFTVDRDLESLREELIGAGVAMGEIKSFAGFGGPFCDGRDPEGNVFQLTEAISRYAPPEKSDGADDRT